jgi:hypothetical protein
MQSLARRIALLLGDERAGVRLDHGHGYVNVAYLADATLDDRFNLVKLAEYLYVEVQGMLEEQEGDPCAACGHTDHDLGWHYGGDR